MSVVTLDEIKTYLDVIHNEDDAKLQELINGAEDEALQFLDVVDLPKKTNPVERDFDSNTPEPASDSDDLAPSVRMAVYLLVQGMYEAKDAAEMMVIRKAAETKLMPYRAGLGC